MILILNLSQFIDNNFSSRIYLRRKRVILITFYYLFIFSFFPQTDTFIKQLLNINNRLKRAFILKLHFLLLLDIFHLLLSFNPIIIYQPFYQTLLILFTKSYFLFSLFPIQQVLILILLPQLLQ